MESQNLAEQINAKVRKLRKARKLRWKKKRPDLSFSIELPDDISLADRARITQDFRSQGVGVEFREDFGRIYVNLLRNESSEQPLPTGTSLRGYGLFVFLIILVAVIAIILASGC